VLTKIEQLLEKYDNGETTLQEEQQLKNYFSQETVAPHLEMYKPLFTYFVVNQQEQFTKDVPLKSKTNNWYKWISVAAVAVIMLSVYFNQPNRINDYGTYDDPEMAFNEVKQSLEMISSHFNKGASSINYLKEVENATSLVFKK
jgi:hypothetical protein